MRRDDMHATDEDLVRLADGELDARHASEVRAHLEACWPCRARSHTLEAVVADLTAAHREVLDAGIPPDAGPRADLVARLTSTRAPEPMAWHVRLRRLASARPAWSTAGAAAAALALLFLLPTLPWNMEHGELEASEVPDATLTPGWALADVPGAVCEAAEPVGPPVVARPVALAIFERYGIRDPEPQAYELDYLIAPELGGSTDVRNLWPQSYTGTWNAHHKDALEDYLALLVCRGELDLDLAQREIAGDWVAAYRKYFRTDVPLESHRTFRKDQPWG